MNKPSPRRSLNAKRWTIALVVILVALSLAFALVPRYRTRIATVDDAHRWPKSAAPPRREIVWQPAQPLMLEIPEAANSQIRPQLTPSGGTLYFTVRTPDNNFDIVRSQRAGEGWSKPELVAILNSEADDVGPVIRDDGKTLYLYSNRDGGLGGMDLYVSHWHNDQWSKPVNLGPNINSVAHEYDPAVSPDGLTLYFSSNRSEQTPAAGPDHWSTTLRSDPGNRTFDLYVAQSIARDQWQPATALAGLNSPDHNDGAPFVSPDGAFLYFVSDRPTKRQEAKNFDVYRARIDRGRMSPENLGPSINTSASEIEPALTSAGFRLQFSRSSQDRSSHYALFESTAKEVYHDGRWEQAHGGAIADFARRVFDRLWLILLFLAALAALVWLIRQLRLRRVAVPGFLALALLLHFFLVTGSFFVYFQNALTKRLRQMFSDDTIVATEVLLSSTVTTSNQPEFDQVAELEMPVPITPSDVAKKTTERQSDPLPIELAEPQQIVGNTPSPSQLPIDVVVASFLTEDVQPTNPDSLPRAAIEPVPPTEDFVFEETVAVKSPTPEAVEPTPAELQRQEIAPTVPAVDPVMVKAVELAPAPTTITSDPRELPDRPAPNETVPDTQLERAPTKIASKPAAESVPVATETIAAVEVKEVVSPAPQLIELQRVDKTAEPALPQPEPIKLTRKTERAPQAIASETIVPLLSESEPAAEVLDPSQNPLMRVKATAASTADEAPVATEQIKLVADPSELPHQSPSATVDIQRRSIETAAVTVSSPPIESPIVSRPAPAPAAQAPVKLVKADTPRSADPLASALSRRNGNPTRVYADTQVNLQSLLLRRKLDEATKMEVVKAFGGNDETLVAIRRGLVWIQQHQERDGHWSIHEFHKHCEGHKHCDGRGSSRSDTAGTGLALLPFLGDGNTHKEGTYKDVVAAGITWLVTHQEKDGNLFTGGEGNAFMYSHGIATIALCECYGMTKDPALREPCQRAIDFIVAAQDPKSGGWRYKPRAGADTSVVGWQVMALKSAQMAELNVPADTLQEAQRWLETVAGDKKRLGQFSYQHNNNFNPAMTAEAMLCLEYMDNQRDSPLLVHGTEFLMKNLPKQGRDTSYFWYYGTQAMFHLQGEHWDRWNDAIHPLLIETQRKEGPMSGTWDPRDQWEKGGGRIYATSLRVLMLEVYYRHLPIYQVID